MRKKYSEGQQVALISQVDQVCPLCGESLFYKKDGRSYKKYELAHIYPLNPTKNEEELLENEDRLSEDVNSVDNIIPLCRDCHGKLDNPRTVREYRELFDLKQKFISASKEQENWKRNPLVEEISSIIKAIYDSTESKPSIEIDFSTKKVDEKLDNTMSRPTSRKIKHNVQDYFVSIREELSLLDQTSLNKSEIISAQIKLYYLTQKKDGRSQQEVFENLVKWVNAKSQADTIDAAEIIISFFIQNCEVFE